MFEEGEATTVTIEPEAAPEAPAETAEVRAAQAEASAQAAAEAAAASIAMADVTAARAVDGAAAEVASYEARLNECQLALQSVTQSQAESSAAVANLNSRMESLTDQLSSTLARLEAMQASPASPSEELPNGEAQAAPQEAEPPPPEPSPPERRRAHRWI